MDELGDGQCLLGSSVLIIMGCIGAQRPRRLLEVGRSGVP